SSASTWSTTPERGLPDRPPHTFDRVRRRALSGGAHRTRSRAWSADPGARGEAALASREPRAAHRADGGDAEQPWLCDLTRSRARDRAGWIARTSAPR